MGKKALQLFRHTTQNHFDFIWVKRDSPDRSSMNDSTPLIDIDEYVSTDILMIE